MANILLSAAVLLASVSLSAAAEVEQTVITRFGTLTVESEPGIYALHTVKLDETTVFEAQCHDVTLSDAYALGAQDVVVIDAGVGGMSWEFQELALLVLEAGKEPRTLRREGFGFGGSTGDFQEWIALEDGRLEIDLEWARGRRKIARYDGRRLSIVFEYRGRLPLSEGDCQEAYAAVLACATARQGLLPSMTDPGCKDPEESFAGVTMRSVASISGQPGFNERRFHRACVTACKSGHPPPLDDAFRKSVCGMGK